MRVLCFFLIFLEVTGPAKGANRKSSWMQKGQEELRQSLLMRNTRRLAKNVIVFVGSGMGVSTVTAARAYKAHLSGQSAAETQLNFEQFPHVALSKTYCADQLICDGGSTSTAILGGVKANSGTLGVTAAVSRSNCSLLSDDSTKVKSMLTWFAEAGKSVGVVTTSHVTNPTPASAYAHSADAAWESDAEMAALGEEEGEGCGQDIASQLIFNNPDIQVILGGGRRAFMNRTTPDPETGDENSTNSRLDGRDLIQEWVTSRSSTRNTARYVWHAGQFRNVSADDTDYLLGLFSPSDMAYEAERDPDDDPSIAEMTKKAINILSKNEEGFFLLVHAGRIESGYKDNELDLALAETVAMDDAVGVAMEMTDQDTLIVVTADRAVASQQASADSEITNVGNLETSAAESQISQEDSSNSTTTSVKTGQQPSADNTTDPNSAYSQMQDIASPAPQTEDPPNENPDVTSVGEDVAIYARGPMAVLFHGVREQNFIAHALSFAACVGPSASRCDRYRQRGLGRERGRLGSQRLDQRQRGRGSRGGRSGGRDKD